jgi:hypothetical protein
LVNAVLFFPVCFTPYNVDPYYALLNVKEILKLLEKKMI